MPQNNLVLYYMDASPPCRSVMMVIKLLGLDVTIKEVNLINKEQKSPEFEEKNVLQKIPVLEDGDFTINDSHAIITYLVSKFGAEYRSLLYPNDLRLKTTIDQLLYFDVGVLFSRFAMATFSILYNGATELSDDLKEKLEECYGFIEKYLERQTCLAADHVTLADIAVVATVSTMNTLLPVDAKYIKLHEWWNRLKEADWYKEGNAGLQQYEGLLKTILERNAKK